MPVHGTPDRYNFGGTDGAITKMKRSDAKIPVLITEWIDGQERRLVRYAANGLPDPANRDISVELWADFTDASDLGVEHWVHFRGHRVLVDIVIESRNSRYVHEWKGFDEIRGSTTATVMFNGIAVAQLSNPDIFQLLQSVQHHIRELMACDPVMNHVSGEARYATELVGRKIYYRDQPAIIDRVTDLFELVISPVAAHFVTPPWSSWDMDDEGPIVVDVLSPHVYWYRDL